MRELRSQTQNVLLSKIWAPILCVVASLLSFSNGVLSAAAMFAIPFLLLACFMASLAVVEVRGGAIRYRRLAKWTVIAQDQVSDARVEWAPFIGSIKLRRFIFPWGRLYFVLDADSNPNPLRESEYPLLKYLRNETIRENQGQVQAMWVLKLRLWVAAILGALVGAISQLTGPDSAHGAQPQLRFAWQIFAWQISDLLGRIDVVSFLLVLFVFLAFSKYRQRGAWIYSLLAGISVAHIVLHFARAVLPP